MLLQLLCSREYGDPCVSFFSCFFRPVFVVRMIIWYTQTRASVAISRVCHFFWIQEKTRPEVELEVEVTILLKFFFFSSYRKEHRAEDR